MLMFTVKTADPERNSRLEKIPIGFLSILLGVENIEIDAEPLFYDAQ